MEHKTIKHTWGRTAGFWLFSYFFVRFSNFVDNTIKIEFPLVQRMQYVIYFDRQSGIHYWFQQMLINLLVRNLIHYLLCFTTYRCCHILNSVTTAAMTFSIEFDSTNIICIIWSWQQQKKMNKLSTCTKLQLSQLLVSEQFLLAASRDLLGDGAPTCPASGTRSQ